MRFGALEFRGGLELTSKDPRFGGISALHMDADGSHFLALSDRGAWLKGRIVYRDGRPAGLAGVEMAPILAWDGKPLAKHGWYDTESLDRGRRRPRLCRHRARRKDRALRFEERASPPAAGRSPCRPTSRPSPTTRAWNASRYAPKGSPLAGQLIAVTERSLDAAGNHRAFLLNGKQVGRFSVKRSDGFDVSDCAILPPNDLLLLERSYSPLSGVAMRIRRIPLAAIKPGALVDGTPLIVADLAYQIDNMEGIGVSRDAQGDTILTLVSDDNFSALQRTLLLQFKLVGE